MRSACIVLAGVLVAMSPARAYDPWADDPFDVVAESIQPQPVSNGGFDLGLAPWLPTSYSAPNPDAYTTWSPLDHAGEATSGSIQFVNLVPNAGNTIALGADCFSFEDASQAIRVRLRYHVPAGSGRLWIQLWTGFGGDMGETGCYGPGLRRLLGGPVGNTEGFVEFDSGWLRVFGAMGHIIVGFSPYNPMPAYVAHIDDVRVDTAIVAPVFSDGLEQPLSSGVR